MQQSYKDFSEKIDSIVNTINQYREKKEFKNLLEEIYKLHHFSEDFFINLELSYVTNNKPITELKIKAKQYFDGLSKYECKIPIDYDCDCLDDLINFLKQWIEQLKTEQNDN